MLTLSDIFVSYGMIAALKGVSLEVRQGEIVALIGANGAGKSTTLMSISGVAGLQAGAVSFDGRTITGMPPHKIVGLGICQVPEGRHIFPRMTVRENLEMGAYAVRDRAAREASLEKVHRYFPVLERRARQRAGTLSGGEQQMLAVGRALMSRPRLLLLDEPSLGLAPRLVDQVFEIVRRINQEERVGILLVEQNANEALLHADRAYVLENGRVTLEGPAEELRKDRRVIAAYLGG